MTLACVESHDRSHTLRVESYDPTSDLWRGEPQSLYLEVPSLARSAIVSAGGDIYIIGGDGGRTAAKKGRGTWVFDPATVSLTDTGWILIEARDRPAAVALGNSLYVLGGRPGGASDRPPYRGGLASVEELDLGAGNWNASPPMLMPRERAAAAEHGGRLFVFGGRELGEPLDDVEVYDPATQSWQFVTPMPHPSSDVTAESDGTRIYVLGRFRRDRERTQMWSYDPVSDVWTAESRPPVPGRFWESEPLGTEFYVTCDGFRSAGSRSFLAFDATTSTWRMARHRRHSIRNSRLGMAGGRIYVLGGIEDHR